MTLDYPLYPEDFLGGLYAKHSKLVEKRNELLKLPFLFLRFKQRKNLKAVDQQLDSLESEIAKLKSEQSRIEIKAAHSFIEDNERWILDITSKISRKK